jgi:hypothetical protein
MIEVKLRNKNNPQAEPVCLTLPASHEDEAAAKTKLGMENLSECTLAFELPDDLPHAENIFHNMKREKRFWQELNFFARQLSELSHDDRALLDGALVIHSPEDMKAALPSGEYCRGGGYSYECRPWAFFSGGWLCGYSGMCNSLFESC